MVAPGCPRSGTFQDWFLNDHPSTRFSQVCEDKLLTLRYDRTGHEPMSQRFSNPQGVSVRIMDYGKTQSAPFYEPMYEALEADGYTRNKNIRVAGYDARLTPDMAGFVHRTKRLIENTYRQNGHTPVHLVGHSNGPLYAQYLLTHTSRAWKRQYIHGFTPIAGNLPGQGVPLSAALHRAQHRGLLVPGDDGQCHEQRAHVPDRAVELHERGRPADLRRRARPSSATRPRAARTRLVTTGGCSATRASAG